MTDGEVGAGLVVSTQYSITDFMCIWCVVCVCVCVFDSGQKTIKHTHSLSHTHTTHISSATHSLEVRKKILQTNKQTN